MNVVSAELAGEANVRGDRRPPLAATERPVADNPGAVAREVPVVDLHLHRHNPDRMISHDPEPTPREAA